MIRDEYVDHTLAHHYVADGNGLLHAPAHIWIERKIPRSQQQLTGAGIRYRGLFETEIIFFRLTDGTGCQDDPFGT
jgi:hypothetical protein